MMLKVAPFHAQLLRSTPSALWAILNYSHCHSVQIDTWKYTPYREGPVTEVKSLLLRATNKHVNYLPWL